MSPSYVQSMFSVREVPWHGKGKIVQNALTAAEAIVEAGLDWRVEKREVSVAGVPLEGWYATVRTDTGDVLGIVKERYEPVQNVDLLRFLDPVVEEKSAVYHTGGSLLGGRKVWLLAQLPGEYYVEGVEDDLLQNFVLVAGSHDGTMHVIAKHTPIRVVCWNTFSMALAVPATEVRIKHTKGAQYQLAHAHKVLGLATRRMGLLQEAASKLASYHVTNRVARRFLRRLLPSRPEKAGGEPAAVTRNRRERIELLALGSNTNTLPGMQESAWAWYNAVAEYVDHDRPERGGSDRLDQAWFGGGEALKHKAFKLLMEQVTKGDLDA